MNSDVGFLRLATKLGIPSVDFGLGEFPSEDQCTGNSQSLQSEAIILHAWGGGEALLNEGDRRRVRH